MTSTFLACSLVLCAACIGCRTRAIARPDSTALAEAVAATINDEGPEETVPGHSKARVSDGATAWDARVATILRTRYGSKFRADDDSVYVRRIATSGVVYRGDTAFVTAVAAICVHPRSSDPFTFRGSSVEYRYVPAPPADGDSGPRWRSIGPGLVGALDGECQASGWNDRWWEITSRPANDR